jgi:hypothetical protein
MPSVECWNADTLYILKKTTLTVSFKLYNSAFELPEMLRKLSAYNMSAKRFMQ